MCTKTALIRTLRTYYSNHEEAKLANYGVFDTIPTSFILIAGVEDNESIQFISRWKEISSQNFQKESVPAKHCEENMWLVKPANLNQGRGIEVFRKAKDIFSFIGQKQGNTAWVVQKYIEKPLLFKGRKFDIRIWVLVTNKNEVLFYRHGYMRTSSDRYDTKDPNNYVHLTNNCLQQFGDNYGKFEDGNTLSLEVLAKYIKQCYPEHTVNFEQHIIQRMKDIVIDTFLAWKRCLNTNNRKNCFELFGYDFLIDEDLRTWLLEVNTNPYLGVANDYIADLLPKMIDDLLELTTDLLFPPNFKPRQDRSNGFELIYCENNSTLSSKAVNVRSSFFSDIYPVKELEQPSKKQKPNMLFLLSKGLITTPELEDTKTDEIQLLNNQDGLNLEETHKILKNHLNFKMSMTLIDLEWVGSKILQILSFILSAEEITDRQVNFSCKIMQLISNSPAVGIFVEAHVLSAMAKLLISAPRELNILTAMLDVISTLAKDIVLCDKIICNRIVHSLMEIVLTSCSLESYADYSEEIRMHAYKVLENMCVLVPKKTPVNDLGESERIRFFFATQGGVIALWVLSKKSNDERIRGCAERAFKNFLTSFDWNKQMQILEAYKKNQGENNSDTYKSSEKTSFKNKGIITFKSTEESLRTNKNFSKIIQFPEYKSCLMNNCVNVLLIFEGASLSL